MSSASVRSARGSAGGDAQAPIDLVVRVPATTANLGPGFDAFGLALSRYLVVRARPRRPGEPRVVTTGEGAGELADGDDNLIWRSLLEGCRQWHLEPADLQLMVVNAIPTERGLGSSSSAIVAGLTIARALTGQPVSDQQVVEVAARLEGHPDNVAPAVLGGLVAGGATDDGELVLRRINPTEHLRIVACIPTQRQSTSGVRSVLPESLSRDDVVAQASRAAHVLMALAGSWPVDARLTADRLHEPVRRRAMPASGSLLDQLRAAGLHAWLSGAGPSVAVAVATDDDRQVVGSLADAAGFLAADVAVDLSGAILCPAEGCAYAAGGTCVQCPRKSV